MKKLIAGNWKMNLTLDEAKILIADIVNAIHFQEDLLERCDFLVCPPALYIPAVRHTLRPVEHMVGYGAQDCSPHGNGAHTGDLSATMLADSGCGYVIVGHSERRIDHGESDAVVKAKAAQVQNAGMTAIICVGEQEAQREAGQEEQVVGAQLENSLPDGASANNTVIAYEPVWAIGTGKTATPVDVAQMHAFIRDQLSGRIADHENVRILYGGSMKPTNAAELLSTPNVDGGLIGGASLTAEDFVGIAKTVY